MSFLGYNSFLGYSTLQTVSPFVTTSTYTGLKVFGDCIIDNIHMVNYTMTEDEINAIDSNQTPTWIGGKTIFLATFDSENLDGGNVKGLVSPITEWVVLRKKVSDSKYTELARLDDLVESVYKHSCS